MTYITVAAICALALVAVAALHVVGQLIRSHARERNLMLNQLLHLAGRTWQAPPSEVSVEAFDPDELLDERFTTSPTQLPDY